MVVNEFNETQRAATIRTFYRIADLIQTRRIPVIRLLRSVEPKLVAEQEVDKTIRTLRSYSSELSALAGRRSFGDVAVALPFNNPLYSLVLYCCGPLLGGSTVHVRPSAASQAVVSALIEMIAGAVGDTGIILHTENGKDFLSNACYTEHIRTLLFTGSWSNISNLLPSFPESKKLIYCGASVTPFIVCDEDSSERTMQRYVDLAVESRIYNSGQDCLCAERFYILDTVADAFIDLLAPSVSTLAVGDFSNDEALITPLVVGSGDRLARLAEQAVGTWIVPFQRDGDLVHPSLIEVSQDSRLLDIEKFAPMFVVTRYSEEAELHRALLKDYRFGATVCGPYSSSVLLTYPHVCYAKSVIDVESEDAHVPFGGRLRSGFVKYRGETRDGPILYSLETTELD